MRYHVSDMMSVTQRLSGMNNIKSIISTEYGVFMIRRRGTETLERKGMRRAGQICRPSGQSVPPI